MYGNTAREFAGLAEHWNGTTWSQQELPAPESGGGIVLSTVSCVASATSCTAVGFNRDKSDINSTLAEHWNGTEWSVEATPTPGTPGVGTEVTLEGVSCPSIVVCVALGRGPGVFAEVDPPEEITQKIREAEARRHEAAEKKVHEEEAATKKANEEKLAVEKKANEHKSAALKTAEEKEAAETKAHEEEAAAQKKVDEEEAATKKANEEKLAAEKANEEKVKVAIPTTNPVATLAAAPVVLPTNSTTVGPWSSGVKRLTEAHELKACNRLPRKKRIVCEAKIKKSSGKYKKK